MNATTQRFTWAIAILLCAVLLNACADGKKANEQTNTAANNSAAANQDDGKGVGPAQFVNIELGPVNADMVAKGQTVYDIKCSACHSLGEDRKVGPGWKNVTTRHKPEWIMNMMINPDAMLDKDAKAKEQLEVCLVRMPNQNLTFADGRNVLEFMRKHDGAK
jgi:cytochrome c2